MRAHRPGDFEASAAMWGDAEMTRFIGGMPSGREQSWRRLLSYAGHWTFMGFGYWAIADRKTDRFLGDAGFADFRREITPPIGAVPEIGWSLTPQAWGRGIATEAVRAVTAWGDGQFSPARTMCLIDPGNRASIRVAEKAGYVKIRETMYKDNAILWFERG